MGIGWYYLVTPVSITRYFEFPFAYSCLPAAGGQCLDLSSPRLFSLYVLHQDAAESIRMINPDQADLANTARIAGALGERRMDFVCAPVASLTKDPRRYDVIWSISVIEHIAGDNGDTAAMRTLHDKLHDGGRLIVTVPVGKAHRDEYRATDVYGTAAPAADGRYFFQRFYDKETIQSRLLEPLGRAPTVLRWFGETVPGRFHSYIQAWLCEGHERTIRDPQEIADWYREYETWEEMPGTGVCGFAIER
jgi:hypothetical protein